MARDAQMMNVMATAFGASSSKEGAKAFNSMVKKMVEESK